MALLDTFTDSAGTLLRNHVANSGQAWTPSTGYTSTNLTISAAGTLYCSTGSTVHYIAVAADTVAVRISYLSTAIDGDQVGFIAKAGTGFAGYAIYVQAGTWHLLKIGTGEIAAWADAAWSPGQSRTVVFSIVGTAVTVVIDGTQRMSATDATPLTGVNTALYFQQSATSTTGIHIDEITDSAIPSDYTTHTVSASDLTDNTRSGVDAPKQTAFARLLLSTTAAALYVSASSTIAAAYPAWSHLGWYLDGVDQGPLSLPANGSQIFRLSLGTAGTSRTVEIVGGLQSMPSDTILGTFIDAVSYPAGSTNIASPYANRRVAVIGDSVSVGANATYPYKQGFAALLRSIHGKHITIDSWGYGSMYDLAANEAAVTASVSRIAAASPTVVYIAMGTNDCGLSKWSASAFGVGYAAFVDALHAALPSTRVIAQTPIIRTSGAAALQDYRDQITTLAGSRAWIELLDGTSILSSGDLSDGVHPSTAGHAVYAAEVAAVLGVLPPTIEAFGGDKHTLLVITPPDDAVDGYRVLRGATEIAAGMGTQIADYPLLNGEVVSYSAVAHKAGISSQPSNTITTIPGSGGGSGVYPETDTVDGGTLYGPTGTEYEGTGMTSAQVGTAISDALATAHVDATHMDRLDANVSTRAATGAAMTLTSEYDAAKTAGTSTYAGGAADANAADVAASLAALEAVRPDNKPDVNEDGVTAASGNWATAADLGNLGTGAYPVTLTFTDGTNPLEGVSVRMVMGATMYTGKTDATGEIEFAAEAGTYTVYASLAGYQFTPTTKVVPS